MENPKEVISALERSTGVDRALDAEIATLCGFTRVLSTRQRWRSPTGREFEPLPRLTYSLDAGKALANELFPDLCVAIAWGEEGWKAQVEDGPICFSKTGPAALCLAILGRLLNG